MDTKIQFSLTPNVPVDFKVCRNDTNQVGTCGSSISFTLSLGAINSPTVYPIDSERASIVFKGFFAPDAESRSYSVETLGLNHLGEGEWLTVATVKAIDESETTYYSVTVTVEPGITRLYRISLFPKRTESFWFTPPAKKYSGDAVSVSRFLPTEISSSSGQNEISSTSSLSLSFDLQGSFSPNCIANLISARLVLSPNGEPVHAGFVRVYEKLGNQQPEIQNKYLSNVAAQFSFDSTTSIDLDHNLVANENFISRLSAWNTNSEDTTLLVTLEKTNMGKFILSNSPTNGNGVSLEIATLNSKPDSDISSKIITSIFPFTIDLENPFFQDTVELDVAADEIVTEISVTVTGTFAPAGYLSAGLQGGAIGDIFVDDSMSSVTITSAKYSYVVGGFPLNRDTANELYIFYQGAESADTAVITSITIVYTKVSGTATPCTGFIQSPSPVPSPSPVSSPSPALSASLSSSPAPSATGTIPSASSSPIPSIAPSGSSSPLPTPSTTPNPPSPTAFQSVNIAPPAPIPTAPVPSKKPTPSRVSAPTQTRTATPTPNRAVPTPVIQPTKAPATAGPIPISDENGDVVVIIDLGEQNDGNTLVVSPVANIPVLGSSSIESLLVSFVLLDKFGFEIQPSADVEICISAPAAQKDDSCLGFLDESAKPPRWKCEDPCLEQNKEGFLCGNTDHFTSFAVLLDGTGNSCKGSGDLIFDEGWQDAILISSVSAGILCILLVITVFLAVTKIGSKVVRGDEGHRISKLRNSSLMETSVVEV
eukprot:CAMPEP_0117026342 /NCGR_PEP_ID=MMETSP0472-20121206/19379_1 /TAXON_ID=693140 ORGANISM="Tiarina fusus, Strain LIS" /NCGR_SAMPLE_ID=MMETSP0472 /ASSEMBLY_ACC=CAM_ASM_000603 /LENGTH=766 /DNA_ID=CAMNT_0004733329 /DNA_START=201 /DNA_END=2501 /DNA_ORIENTATION=-